MRFVLTLVAAGPRAALDDLLHAIEGLMTPGMPPLRQLGPPVAGLLAGWYGYVAAAGWLDWAARVLAGGWKVPAVLIEFSPAVLVGVPLLRAAASGTLEWWQWRRWLFGPGVVLALAPFVAVATDYYLLGSILVTSVLPGGFSVLRSDDLFLLIEQLDARQVMAPGGRLAAGAVCTLGLTVGAVLAGWTYLLGAWWHGVIARAGAASPAPRGRAG
ncbi:MAG: hypothetical protein ACREAA_14455 [Candidatus Polarisedimenticolia bacterium]